jgi:hypothetical protein
MTRSKFSTKVLLLATGIGLSTAAFAGLQPAAAQSYACPVGTMYDPTYGCTTESTDDFGGYYGYPTVLYGRHGGFDHGFAHGMGGGFAHGMGVAHVGGFGHMGGGFGGFHGGGFGGGHR